MRKRTLWIVALALVAVCGPRTVAGDDISFKDVTATCGLDGAGGDRFAFGDYDGDGDPDLLVNASRLYRNDSKRGTIKFTDVTPEVGIKGAGGGGACWFDFNRDGHLDFVTNSGQVWLGSAAGTFENVAERLGIKVPAGKAAAIGCGDIDGDGWVDIVTGGDESRDPPGYLEQTLWLNKKGEKLVHGTVEAGLGERRYGRAMVWCDYDWDGDADLYSGNYRLQPNSLYRNRLGKFEDVAPAAGVTGRNDPTMFVDLHTGKTFGYQYGHTIGASWADLTNDGFFDIWVSNLAHKAYGKVSPDFAKRLGTDYDIRGYVCDDSNIFINGGPPDWTFTDERVARGIPIVRVVEYPEWRGDELWSNAACGDADNNGWLDVYVNQVYGNQPNSFALFFQNEEGKFKERHRRLPKSLWGGYGSAWADLDSDGWLDLVAGGAPEVDGKRQIHVFHNRGSGGSWIGFDIRGTEEVQAVGTKVMIVQADMVQVRQVETTMGSHTQQNDMRLHFGLGTGGRILDVIVYWSDGRAQSLGDPATRRYHPVARSRAPVPRIGRVTPWKTKAGVATEFATSGGGRGARYYWSFGGTRRVDQVTDTLRVTHTYEEPGEHHGLVRVVRAGACSEMPFKIVVEE